MTKEKQKRIEHILEMFNSFPKKIQNAIVTGAVLALMGDDDGND